MAKISSPICLNLDNSLLFPIAENNKDKVFNLSEQWQELLRFSTSWKVFNQWQNFLQNNIFNNVFNNDNKNIFHEIYPIFFGSGDFHHLTYSFLKFINDNNNNSNSKTKISLIVLDNHPDNMRFPFGIHCGSWVYHAAKLDIIKEIYVLGMTSDDICISHIYENHLTPFLLKKLHYWSINKSASWLKFILRNNHQQCFSSADELVETFAKKYNQNLVENNQKNNKNYVYLSIDKDVLSSQFLTTNWDQGVFNETNLFDIIKLVKNNLVGVDICGEFSNYTYKSKFKTFLSNLDGQDSNNNNINIQKNIQEIHLQQQTLNQKIYSTLLNI